MKGEAGEETKELHLRPVSHALTLSSLLPSSSSFPSSSSSCSISFSVHRPRKAVALPANPSQPPRWPIRRLFPISPFHSLQLSSHKLPSSTKILASWYPTPTMPKHQRLALPCVLAVAIVTSVLVAAVPSSGDNLARYASPHGDPIFKRQGRKDDNLVESLIASLLPNSSPIETP